MGFCEDSEKDKNDQTITFSPVTASKGYSDGIGNIRGTSTKGSNSTTRRYSITSGSFRKGFPVIGLDVFYSSDITTITTTCSGSYSINCYTDSSSSYQRDSALMAARKIDGVNTVDKSVAAPTFKKAPFILFSHSTNQVATCSPGIAKDQKAPNFSSQSKAYITDGSGRAKIPLTFSPSKYSGLTAVCETTVTNAGGTLKKSVSSKLPIFPKAVLVDFVTGVRTSVMDINNSWNEYRFTLTGITQSISSSDWTQMNEPSVASMCLILRDSAGNLLAYEKPLSGGKISFTPSSSPAGCTDSIPIGFRTLDRRESWPNWTLHYQVITNSLPAGSTIQVLVQDVSGITQAQSDVVKIV